MALFQRMEAHHFSYCIYSILFNRKVRKKKVKQMKQILDTKTTWETKLNTLILNSVFPKVVDRVLLYGSAGTGKSSYPFYIGEFIDQMGLEDSMVFNGVERLTLSPDDTSDIFMGQYMPQKDGTLQWQDGAVIRAMKLGKILVLDEVDECSPECLPILNAILDDKDMRLLHTPEGVIKPADGFAVFATTNKRPNELRPSLRSRFDVKLLADTPTNGALNNVTKKLQKILLNQTESLNEELYGWSDDITTRSCIAFTRICEALNSRSEIDVQFEGSIEGWVAHLIFGKESNYILAAFSNIGNELS